MPDRLAEIKEYVEWGPLPLKKDMVEDAGWLIAEVGRLRAERVQLIQGLDGDARELKRLRAEIESLRKRVPGKGKDLVSQSIQTMGRESAELRSRNRQLRGKLAEMGVHDV